MLPERQDLASADTSSLDTPFELDDKSRSAESSYARSHLSKTTIARLENRQPPLYCPASCPHGLSSGVWNRFVRALKNRMMATKDKVSAT